MHMGSMKDKAKGKWEEAKGKGKQAAGDLTDNPGLAEEGEIDETKGKGRQNVGKAKEWVKEKIDN
jgi:uncharacterized protein YjbJ (UPF0337 family)